MYQMPPPGYPVAPPPQLSGPCGQNPSPNGTAEKRVLYVGNLAPDCTEQILVAVFAQFGECLACKIIRGGNPGSDNYAFMELGNHQQAQVALTAMNRISLMGRELRVNWATAPGAKPDPSKGSHVFVGDLVPDIEESEIMDVFVPYGPILECKIIRHQDGGFKTYAFLTYENEPDANTAISAENGNLLRFKPMRVSWASRRNNPGGFGGGFGGGSNGGGGGGSGDGGRRRPMKRNYDDVYNETTLYNTSVYFGGIQHGLTEALVRENFNQFGNIQDVKVHEDKGFAFIRFDSHDAATQAIVAMHGATVGGFTAKLGWGKEGANAGATGAASTAATVGPSPAKSAKMDSNLSGGVPAAPQMPSYNDPAYQKYYAEYMEWYNKYSGAYYGAQQPQVPQAPPRPTHPPPVPPTSTSSSASATASQQVKKEKAK